jgi:hypothetical protein
MDKYFDRNYEELSIFLFGIFHLSFHFRIKNLEIFLRLLWFPKLFPRLFSNCWLCLRKHLQKMYVLFLIFMNLPNETQYIFKVALSYWYILRTFPIFLFWVVPRLERRGMSRQLVKILKTCCLGSIGHSHSLFIDAMDRKEQVHTFNWRHEKRDDFRIIFLINKNVYISQQ